MNDIRFDRATPHDFERYYGLRKKTMLEHFINAGKRWPDEEERVEHYKKFNPETLRIIYLKDEKIGCINVERISGELRISSFCIEPHYQKQGHGTQILQRILGEPENLKLPCTLDVLVGNPSYRIYERLGFIKTRGPLDMLVYYARPAQA